MMQRILLAATCVTLAALCSACWLEPKGERPGFGISGELTTEPVADWSFAHGQPAPLQLVNPPGSRELGTTMHDGKLYVPCDLGFIADRA
ncbi:MAG TPA: hypothetical protein VIY27_13445 [Myxococcota bacterium]